MRAVRFDRFGGPEVLQIVELPDPHPARGEIRVAVRAAGVNASDWKKREGLMDPGLPQTLSHEASGLVDQLGEGVTGVAIGDPVFGFCTAGDAQAELAVLSLWAPVPAGVDLLAAAALPSALETAARALDQVHVRAGTTVVINGASGNVGGAATQLAVARGATVIGIASPASAATVRRFGAVPVAYGDGVLDRVREAAPDGVDAAVDTAGNGVLQELVDLTGGPASVVTVADPVGARRTGVVFSRGDSGRALYVLDLIGDLVASGRFVLPEVHAYPLAEVAAAQRESEHGHLRAKIVLTADRPVA